MRNPNTRWITICASATEPSDVGSLAYRIVLSRTPLGCGYAVHYERFLERDSMGPRSSLDTGAYFTIELGDHNKTPMMRLSQALAYYEGCRVGCGLDHEFFETNWFGSGDPE